MSDSLVITFDLTLPTGYVDLPIPFMLARGYKKDKLFELFEKLDADGLGSFDRGKQGRGNVGKFTPNEKCPAQYTMTFVIKKQGRPKKVLNLV